MKAELKPGGLAIIRGMRTNPDLNGTIVTTLRRKQLEECPYPFWFWQCEARTPMPATLLVNGTPTAVKVMDTRFYVREIYLVPLGGVDVDDYTDNEVTLGQHIEVTA